MVVSLTSSDFIDKSIYIQSKNLIEVSNFNIAHTDSVIITGTYNIYLYTDLLCYDTNDTLLATKRITNKYSIDIPLETVKIRLKVYITNLGTIVSNPSVISNLTFSFGGWEVDETKGLIHSFNPEPVENFMVKPYPAQLWRIDARKNHSMPFHELLPNIVGLDVWSLERKNIIKVFDMHEPQDGFKSNGLAVLDPSACESWHDDERWDIQLTHPLDPWGKWKFLLCENILLVDGQLFRIDRYNPKISGSERSVVVHARHITEDMAGQLLWESKFEGGTAVDFLNFAFNNTVEPWLPGQGLQHYEFDFSTDITAESGADEYNNTSLWAAMVGADNCFLNKYGGELYRNNFYFSINQRMENARDNAFKLNYRLDMVEIEQIIDYSDFATELWTKDNWGNYWRMYWGGIECDVHHTRIRGAVFNYPDFEGASENLDRDSTALWQTMDFPSVSYKIRLANIKHDPRYSDFLQLQNYSYGDTGTISCGELDISTTQRIVSVHKNELTGEIIDMTLGNVEKSWVRPAFMAGTCSSGNTLSDRQNAAMQTELDNTNLKIMRTWGGISGYTWQEAVKYKWEEIKNGKRNN